jgi:hypothetical protein
VATADARPGIRQQPGSRSVVDRLEEPIDACSLLDLELGTGGDDIGDGEPIHQRAVSVVTVDVFPRWVPQTVIPEPGEIARVAGAPTDADGPATRGNRPHGPLKHPLEVEH